LSIWPAGYGLKDLISVDSTNEEARRMARAGEPGPVWITAREQTAGRGRRGRAWVSPPGNLAATLLIRPSKPAAECAQLSFVAAIAAADTLASFAPAADIKVKWPNDVLAGGRKIAGILLESEASGPGTWLAIGIGLNLAHFPPDTEFPATALADLGVQAPQSPDALALLAANTAKWYDLWQMDGFSPIRDAWLARASGLGGPIRVRLSDSETSGTFEGIDSSGALILRESMTHARTIAAGDVFFGRS
jgi:BirA family biotin operon repressor/biotin-[acetyl-CoA-carboxylase] ligase